DLDAETLRVAGEALGIVDPDALFHVVQDLLISRLVSDEQQAETVVLEDPQRLVGNIRLGIAGPRHPKLSQSARDGFSSRPIVGERVIVEEVLLDLGKVSAGHADLFDDVLDRPGPIPVTADRLGPEAKRAFRAAAASRIERYVRMQEVADEVVLDGQVPL